MKSSSVNRLLQIAFTFSVALRAVGGVADEEPPLPQKQSDDGFDFEPSLRLTDFERMASTESAAPAVAQLEENAQRLETKLERVKRRAIEGERLYKLNILAKVESEKRALEVVRVARELATARLELAKANAVALRARSQGRDGEIPQRGLDEADASVATATANAEEASQHWRRAQSEAAALKVERTRKLLSYGYESRSNLKRAEEQLAALRSQGN